jgi:hypothetical protein
VNDPAAVPGRPTSASSGALRIRHRVCLRRERTPYLPLHARGQYCDEIAFIKRGQILARGTADELKRRIGIGDVIALRLDPPGPGALGALPGVLRCGESDGWVECTVDTAEKRLPQLLRLLHEDGVVVRDLQVREPELGTSSLNWRAEPRASNG